MFRRIWILLLLFLVLTASYTQVYADPQPQHGDSEDFKLQIEQLVRTNMAKGKIPGIYLLVVKNGQTTMSKGFGYSDKKAKLRVTAETEFQLGSLSKAFTGLAVTHLAEEHQLELEKGVSSYLPWFQVRYRQAPAEITLHQLMEQTSGLGTETFVGISASSDKDALERGVRTLANASLSSAPGEKYAYSNVNFNILGLLIEKVSGQSYSNYMNEHIFKPLGLSKTSVREERLPQNLATGYKVSFFGARPYSVPFSLSQAPSGSIITNGEDMTKWLRFNLGIDSVDGYKAVHPTDTTPFDYYGGWKLDAKSNQIQHEGNLENYSSFIVMDPKEKTGVVVLANLNSTYTTTIGEGIMSWLQGHLAESGNSDTYLLTDQIASSIILIMSVLILVFLWLLWNTMMAIRSGRRTLRMRTPQVVLSILLLSVLAFLYVLTVQLPTFIYPNADWSFINDWMPNTTLYGVLVLLGFLTLLTIHAVARLTFRK
ncbi:serine hydrolase domain-containing protein [Paenibacillus harenae]|uniref:serine hydrolase domain-containing protein n=1 Tax=Paenibacillus harenae TaxID=306543 RepID=UPI00048AD32F|nr:serine hydrolase domain-containing protein [Paenibacillus harenae]